jgi:periplasmic protein CpxP/Spy
MKQFLLLFAIIAGFSYSSFAQGGPQRMTVEERVKLVMEKFAEFKLDAAKTKEVDSVFTHYYKGQEKVRQELMGSGERPDPQVLRDKMQPLVTERDDKLKGILTEEQFKKWKDEIEPSLRPQRRPQ